MQACDQCGATSPDAFRVCPMCGTPLAAAPQRQEERKVVSVLFADLVGFTSRSEQMDIEDVRATLADYHGLVREVLERFGATVEKFAGDAVLALFGAPRVREDDAERAVRAGLAIQAELARRRMADPAFDLHARCGVNTGEVVVAVHARPAAGEGMAFGDAVNTAARLQAAAPVDGVMVGEPTRRATGRAVDYRAADAVHAKGKTEPLVAWIALGARPLAEGRGTGARTPFVGRSAELDALWRAFAQVARGREARLVTLVGVPGVGKSRLVWELRQRLDEAGERVTWRQGRSLPYGDGVVFWAFAEMVKGQARVAYSDAADVTAAKLHVSVEALLGADPEATWVESHLRRLLGLPSDLPGAAETTTEAFAGWRRYVEALARRKPLVLVFEDVHWADDALLDFIEHLRDWSADVPLVILCTARPELIDRRPDWVSGEPAAVTLPLAALTAADTARLIESFLGRAALPADLRTSLAERADGNPLYAEELVRMLIDRNVLQERDGAWRLREDADLPALPESVVGLIASRLDALPDTGKALLQQAAIVGRVFWTGAVGYVSELGRAEVEERLDVPLRRELVQPRAGSSIDGEAEFGFAHALTRDVAYSTMLRPQRLGGHLRMARWIEALANGPAHDRVELLAHHYGVARQLAAETGVVVDALDGRARSAFERSGDRAFSLGALTTAAGYFAQALGVGGLEPIDRALLQLRHGHAAVMALGTGRESLEAARATFAAAGDDAHLAEAEVLLGSLATFHGDGEEARTRHERAHDLAIRLDPGGSKARVLTAVATYVFVRGDNDAAVPLAEQAVEAAAAAGDDDLRGKALAVLGTARAHSRPPSTDGIAELNDAIALLARANSPEVFSGYSYLGVIVSEAGDLRRYAELLERARAVERRLGIPRVAEHIAGWEVEAAYWNGAWDDALARADAIHSEYDRAFTRLVTSRIRWARGERATALQESCETLAFARSVGDAQLVMPALAIAARLNGLTGADPEPLVAELAGMWPTVWNLSTFLLGADLAYLLASSPQGAALLDAANRPVGGSLWLDAARDVMVGDHTAAAETYRLIGSRPDAALADREAQRQAMRRGPVG